MCYENCANRKLVCGHTFCFSCVKKWYMQGSGTCPMCRKKVHYRRMPIKKWQLEAEESKKETVFQESFDDLVECIVEDPFFFRPMDELKDLQKTWRAIKDDCSPDELDFILKETGDYYSDRRVHLYKRTYSENGHRYPIPKRPNVRGRV